MNHKTIKRCISALISCLILASGVSAAVPVTADAAGNIIKNSTFESGTSGWGTYKESGGAATLSTKDGH